MNKVLKTVLQDVAIIHWPNGGTDVGPVTGGPTGMPHANGTINVGPTVACHCWANVGPLAKMTLAHQWLPTVAQRWPNRWSTGGPTVACHCWANVGPLAVGCRRWSNGGATGGPTLGHRGRAIWVVPYIYYSGGILHIYSVEALSVCLN